MNDASNGGDASGGTVALFSTSFLPYSQTFIHDELRAHERYDVDVFCKERLNEDRFPYARYVKPPRWAEKIYENTAYWPRFDRIIGRGDYALVHAHFGTGAVYALPYVLRHDLPFVITFHGHDVAKLYGAQRFDPRNWRYWAYSRALFKHADRLLAASNELAELLMALGAPASNIHVYRLGIDLSRFSHDEERQATPQILMVGRFTEKKGFTYGVRAFARAVEAGRAGHLTLVGAGALEMRLRHLAQEAGVASRVTFTGPVDHAEVAEKMAHADVLLTPSVVTREHDRDSGLMVAKEAGASGMAVVGTYHGGLPEIIDDGETGFLVPERDVDALADRLITLLDEPETRARFGQAARAKMKRDFDLHDRVRALEKHYDAVRR